MFWDWKPIFPSYWLHTFKKGPLEGAKRRDMSEPSDQSWIKGSDKQEQPERFHIWTSCQSVSPWKDLQGSRASARWQLRSVLNVGGRHTFSQPPPIIQIFLASLIVAHTIKAGMSQFWQFLELRPQNAFFTCHQGALFLITHTPQFRDKRVLSERLKLYSSLSIK